MEHKTQKTIMVTLFHNLVSKNILNTDALRLLRDSGEYKIILLVPAIKKEFFERHYAHNNFVFEPVEMQSFVNGWFENFMQIVSRLLIDTHYLHYKRRELLEMDRSIFRWFRHICREMVVKFFSDNKFFASIFRFIDSTGSRNDVFQEIINRYKPDLVFSTDLFEQMGAQLIREAKKCHIKTVGMVRSWDNCLSKGLIRVVPDVSIVNNLVIQDELVKIHGVSSKTIEVVGLPQFDNFVNKKLEDRSSFFTEHGLDPKKKLVMFAPGGNVLSNTDGDICNILIRAQAEGNLPRDVQFFIRNHPQHPADLSDVQDRQNVIIQSPGEILDKTTHKETELTPRDQDFLRNILAYTDVLIWVATSLCLDALVYDVPEVVVNFDGYKEKDYYNSVKRYHDEDHMRKMFILKPFQIASNPKELVHYVDMYLHNKEVDSKERELVRSQQLFCVDGHSGERVATVLKRFLV